jgi:hypothetical protein
LLYIAIENKIDEDDVMRQKFHQFFLLVAFVLVWLWTINIQVVQDNWSSPNWAADAPYDETIPSTDEYEFHYVFSTGCNAFQDWQSWTFFYHAHQLGIQHVTRVASGCSKEQQTSIRASHQTQVQALAPSYHLHLTPDFTRVIPGKTYKFFNKPYGLRHWMENRLGFPHRLKEYDKTIFVLMDPDQMLLRPFQRDMTAYASSMKWVKNPTKPVQIQTGQPFAQLYGLGSKWVPAINGNLTNILSYVPPNEAKTSHLHQWTEQEVKDYYVAGPPYLATGPDMYQIVNTWATIVIPVYHATDDFLSEMYAYATAAAHWGLKHHLTHSFMVSNPAVLQEGWHWIDNSEATAVCASTSNYEADSSKYYLPNVLHYCQRYFLGPYFFSKYILPKNYLSCEHPLLVEPELDIASKYETSVTPNGEMNEIPKKQRNRHAFMLCHTIHGLNEAASYWKEHHCRNGNISKTFFFKKHKT